MTINQIIGNKEKTSRIDTELWKKMNVKYSGIETKTEEKTNPIETPQETIEQKIKYVNNTPKLELKILEKTAVNTRTQKEYDNLIQIYDSGEWSLAFENEKNIIKTNSNRWKSYKSTTCIDAGKMSHIDTKVGYYNKKYYQNNKNNWKIISFNDFCKKQGIKPDTIKELNQYYDKNYPNRDSKGLKK